MTIAARDPAFRNAGQHDGLEIWRIEMLKVRPVDKKHYGYFQNVDCYIVLKSHGSPAHSWRIHFWIGDHSSVDEQCVAAYKSVELDDSLDGRPIQYRETQNHESKLFLSYFKNGIRYLDGGIGGGLREVSDSGPHRLFRAKGRRDCRMQQVPLNIDSLNQGDVFILDTNHVIYVWNGPESNRGERIKGAEIARNIRDAERGGRPRIVIIDSDWATHAEFYAELESEPGTAIATAHEDDDAYENNFNKHLKLFRVSDETGHVLVTEVPGPYTQTNLDSKDCFILDLGSSGIYAWLGRGCTEQERKEVWRLASEYLRQQNLPYHTPIVKVTEGNEPAIFRVALNFAADVPQKNDAKWMSKVASINNDRQFDVRSLHGSRPSNQNEYMPDSGRGTVKLWRIVKFSLEPLPTNEHGTFYSGDSYIVFYSSEVLRNGIVYFWLGTKSSLDERASAAMFAAQVDEQESHGAAVQIRVVQGKEPAHFIAIFGGLIVTLIGGAESGFHLSKNESDVETPPGGRLYQIRNNRVIEVQAKAQSLNSNDVFVLTVEQRNFVWIGKGSNAIERETVIKFCEKFALRDEEVIIEGKEPDEFWRALGGPGDYATGGNLMKANLQFTARLFQCSNARGYFNVEEIVDFSQEDLEPDDVMLLDTYSEVFVWIGEGANHAEKQAALILASQYIDADPTGRTQDETPTVIIKQGFEPFNFTGHFPAWDSNFWKNRQSYDELKKSLSFDVTVAHPGRAFSAHQETSEVAQPVRDVLSQGCAMHSIEVLRRPADQLPPGVNPTAKEKHLSDDEFKAVFHVSPIEFETLPKWKQVDAKKRAGLF